MKNSLIAVLLVMLSACAGNPAANRCASVNPEICALEEQAESIRQSRPQ